jgi:polyhydroxyalkanoate synthesis regulator phasin
MKEARSVLEALRARGSEMFAQASAEMMQSPHFVKALQGALRGKEIFDRAAGRALKNMNIPTRSEFKRALSRIDTLEQELAALKGKGAPRAGRRSSKP